MTIKKNYKSSTLEKSLPKNGGNSCLIRFQGVLINISTETALFIRNELGSLAQPIDFHRKFGSLLVKLSQVCSESQPKAEEMLIERAGSVLNFFTGRNS